MTYIHSTQRSRPDVNQNKRFMKLLRNVLEQLTLSSEFKSAVELSIAQPYGIGDISKYNLELGHAIKRLDIQWTELVADRREVIVRLTGTTS